MDDRWNGERLGRPGVWVGGRALVLTLIVLLAITFDRAGDGSPGGLEPGGGWPYPLGYMAALGMVYLTSSAFFVWRRRLGERGVLWVLAADVPVLTAIIHWTGGIDSHFVLIYLPLVLAAGFLRRVSGGVGIALAASACYVLALAGAAGGWLEPRGYGGDPARVLEATGTDTGRVLLNLIMLVLGGLLAGLLGRADAERTRALRVTSRRLERVQQDTTYVVEHLGSGLLSLDETGIILRFNRAAGQILGVVPGAVVGRSAREALPAGTRAFVDWLDAALRGEVPLVRQELEIEQPDGEAVPIGMTGSPVAGEGDAPGGLIVLFQDLTRARQEEAERVRRERLAVIGEMAAGITHEIRNCVKPVSGSLDVLLRELELDGANRRLMELAVRECTRLGHFVNAMLDYGRVNPLVLEPQRIDELVEEVGQMLEVADDAGSEHQVEIRVDASARGATAQVDREQMKQVLLNLAINGLEAMGEERGTLTIGLTAQAGGQQAENGGLITITVEDTGPGMDEATCAQIFEPFFTTKQGGTGFGLAIAASILERHGGTIEVESAPGTGARFRVTLHERVAMDEVLAA
jgi:PAS domain S-box-containing protein